MKFKNQALCVGIKESKGEFEGRSFSSTTFHLVVSLSENSSGRSLGNVSRPFKYGDAHEFDKWAGFESKWPVAGMLVDCEFEIVASRDSNGRESSDLKLLSIKPAALEKKAA